MGLDISAYSGLKPVAHTNDALGDDTILLMDNTDFPGRISPLTQGRYSYASYIRMPHMSYGIYSKWRDWLAKLAGYPAVDSPTPHAHGAWAATEGPFWELINFADNEGTIGTDACKKLLADFNQFEQKAKDSSSGWEFDRYVDLQDGLRLAVNNGCLKFS